MRRIVLWLVGGIAGSVVFWLVQVLTGGPTITEFIGQQIAAAGGYQPASAPVIGWAVHLGVSLTYAALMGITVASLREMPRAMSVGIGLGVAIVLGWSTAFVAPPAISVTISVLGRQGWPSELFPLNTELGLPLWNHIAFFLLNWVVQGWELRIGQGTRRDWWFAISIIGAAFTCLACLTPIAVLGLGAIGLGAWTGRMDAVLVPLLLGFIGLAGYRYWRMRRRTP
jgi:mercuric ion transport protein